jgi:processive 1,2-diacylglycerol beta-glucosyltransferase
MQKQKKILILTVLAGLGHLKSAQALYKQLKTYHKNIDVLLVDPLQRRYKSLRELINKVYLFLANYLPNFWGFVYSSKLLSFRYSIYYFLLSAYKQAILEIYNQYKPDALVCFHPFLTDAACYLKKKKLIKAYIVSIATDYDIHHLSINQYVDEYIVATEKAKQKLILNKIKEDKIKVLGIPIDLHRQTEEKIELPINKKKVLISLGGYNIGPLYKTIKYLLPIEDEDIYFITLTGKNKKLYNKLLKLIKVNNKKNFLILEYTENIIDLLREVDLYLAKPGGLTISEAINIGVGLLLLKPLKQEEENFHYLIHKNLAYPVYNIKNIKNLILDCFAEDSKKIRIMKENQRRVANPNVTWDIAKELIKKIGGEKS